MVPATLFGGHHFLSLRRYLPDGLRTTLTSVMTIEDNRDMVKSYIMVDPLGRFFQNAVGQSDYSYSRPIHEVGAEAAFAEIGFSPEKFALRYKSALLVEAE